MTKSDVQEQIYQWACSKDFTAPYGVLTGSQINRQGRQFLTVTFGRARTLDATVEIYSDSFILLKTSRSSGNQVFRSVADLQQVLETL